MQKNKQPNQTDSMVPRNPKKLTGMCPYPLASIVIIAVALFASNAAALSLDGVASRKTHGSAGIFDLPIATIPAINGNISIEPRAGSTTHLIVFKFNETITAPGAVSTLYSGPIFLTSNARLRARVFQPGLNPGPELSESYLRLGTGVDTFSSNLPLVFLHTDGAIAGVNSAVLTGTNAVMIGVDPRHRPGFCDWLRRLQRPQMKNEQPCRNRWARWAQARSTSFALSKSTCSNTRSLNSGPTSNVRS